MLTATSQCFPRGRRYHQFSWCTARRLQEGGFSSEHCGVAARQLEKFYQLRRLAALCPRPHRPRPAFSTAGRARRGSFSQPDDVSSTQPRLAAPCSRSVPQSRAFWVLVFRLPLLFPIAATRPRPSDEVGCQDRGHSGSRGCARNFCWDRRRLLPLRTSMAAGSLSAFDTFYAGALRA
jgi:hypothetical protein